MMRGRTWVFSPKSKKISDSDREKIDTWTEKWITILKKDHIPKKPPKKWNYIVDIYGKWVNGRFYLCSRYNCPGPNAISPWFENRFARLEYIGNSWFQLFAMRHTGEWIRMECAVSLKKCLERIESDPWFRP